MADKHLLRFLRARDFDLKKTLEMLRLDLEWRKAFEGLTFKTPDFPSIMKFAGTGALYRAGWDKDGRPVIVTKLALVFPREVQDVQEIARFWVAYVHYLNNECELAGVTDYTAIADLAGFSPSRNFSLALTKVLIDILQKYYPERLAYALVLNTPAMFRMLWNMIAPFLEERTKAKVHLLGTSTKLLQEYVPAEMLEKFLGGTHEPWPLPDHIAQTIATDGVTVNTGFFDGLDKPTDASETSGGSSSSTTGDKKSLKKAMSSSRMDRVRNLLRFDTLGRSKGAPKADEVPKTIPRVTVFGATGRTGIEVVKRALQAGYDVAAFVRVDGGGVPPALLKMGSEFGADHLQIVVGNVQDTNDLDRAIETSDAVISCMGAPRSLTNAGEWFVTTGEKIIESMERNGVKRLVVITAAQAKRMSKAWYDSNASIGENTARHIFWQSHYQYIAALEKLIDAKKDVINYTFVRPAQLDDTSTSESYSMEVDEFFVGGGALPRPALANFIIKECVMGNKYIGKGVAMAAKDGQ
jgi:putative NADH-flavin reductase